MEFALWHIGREEQREKSVCMFFLEEKSGKYVRTVPYMIATSMHTNGEVSYIIESPFDAMDVMYTILEIEPFYPSAANYISFAIRIFSVSLYHF